MAKVPVDTEAKLQRYQRQEEESSNFINILHGDIKKITDQRFISTSFYPESFC